MSGERSVWRPNRELRKKGFVDRFDRHHPKGLFTENILENLCKQIEYLITSYYRCVMSLQWLKNIAMTHRILEGFPNFLLIICSISFWWQFSLHPYFKSQLPPVALTLIVNIHHMLMLFMVWKSRKVGWTASRPEVSNETIMFCVQLCFPTEIRYDDDGALYWSPDLGQESEVFFFAGGIQVKLSERNHRVEVGKSIINCEHDVDLRVCRCSLPGIFFLGNIEQYLMCII